MPTSTAGARTIPTRLSPQMMQQLPASSKGSTLLVSTATARRASPMASAMASAPKSASRRASSMQGDRSALKASRPTSTCSKEKATSSETMRRACASSTSTSWTSRNGPRSVHAAGTLLWMDAIPLRFSGRALHPRSRACGSIHGCQQRSRH